MLVVGARVAASLKVDDVRVSCPPVGRDRLTLPKRTCLSRCLRRLVSAGANSFSNLHRDLTELMEDGTLTVPQRCSSPPVLHASDVSGPIRKNRPFEVFGLGEAMIDYSACVSDDLLAEFKVERGSRRVISAEERHEILSRLGDNVFIQAGSSMTNTLVAMAQLARGAGNKIPIGFAGCIGSDSLGEFYSKHLMRHGIGAFECSSVEDQQGSVGCSIVLITPDGERTLLVCPGKAELQLTQRVRQGMTNADVLMIEGYLFGTQQGAEVVKEAVRIAKSHGVDVVVTAGSADVVRHALQDFWEVIEMGVDVFLCNQSEADALLGRERGCCAHEAVRHLSLHFPIVAVTDGANGSYIAAEGQLQTVPPFWLEDPPVDTCGAGDVYAAGLMHGLLRGYDLYDVGFAAARSASAIAQRRGVHLSNGDVSMILADIKETRRVRGVDALPRLEFEEV